MSEARVAPVSAAAFAGAGMFLAAVFAGCGATSVADRNPTASGLHEAEERSAPDEGLVGQEFIRGGVVGISKAREEGRGAMLLFAASW
ncbi:MAG: hypothetical protein L6R43_08565 [Planctomycetes bacterium]|nr:hypothetical protein [Planctomycetota bacterium]